MPGPTNLRFSVSVHVLTYLASHPERPFSSDRLAFSTRISAVHVRKLLGPLRSRGLVASSPGAAGGWRLARPASSITLADVWTALQGGDAVLGQHVANHECPVGRDIQTELAGIDRELGDAIVARLGRTTIADLVTPAMVAADPDH